MVYVESLPPRDPLAVRTIAVDGSSPIQLSDLENFVTAAAATGGGWLPITFHDVCDAGAADFSSCMSTYGPIQDTVFGQFLDWLKASGQPGGAPSGVTVETMRWAMNTAAGTWHVIGLNSGACESNPDLCAAGTPQEKWLQNDLANDTAACTLAFMQTPRFASYGTNGGYPYMQAIWQDLYNAGVDVMMGGHDHWYERFQPLDANGNPDSTYGIRQFIIGTGRQGLMTPDAQLPTSAVLSNAAHGVLQMTLANGSYTWQFLSDTDGSITDSGTGQVPWRPGHLTCPAGRRSERARDRRRPAPGARARRPSRPPGRKAAPTTFGGP